jgi:hypothetical protein
MSVPSGRTSSVAAAESAPNFGTFYLNSHLSDISIIIKEDVVVLEGAVSGVEGPPCKRPRVSSSANDHADVRCDLLTIASPDKALRVIISTRRCDGPEGAAARLPGHKMILWGRSGFFRSKVRVLRPVAALRIARYGVLAPVFRSAGWNTLFQTTALAKVFSTESHFSMILRRCHLKAFPLGLRLHACLSSIVITLTSHMSLLHLLSLPTSDRQLDGLHQPTSG